MCAETPLSQFFLPPLLLLVFFIKALTAFLMFFLKLDLNKPFNLAPPGNRASKIVERNNVSGFRGALPISALLQQSTGVI